MNKGRISIMVATRDRWSEVALLIQSLRTQTYQEWDLIVADESQTPIQQSGCVTMLLNRVQYEGHKVKLITNQFPNGVCYIRNMLIDANDFDNEFCARLDDDVILESDYLEKCIHGIIFEGYDLVSGVTPHMAVSEWERRKDKVLPIINDMELDSHGNIIKYNDDCGYSYITDENDAGYIPAINFRSSAVYRSTVHQKGIRYETNLSPVGFREEAFMSVRMIIAGFKLGVCLAAKTYHFQTPSGGCRFPDYQQKVQQDEQTWRAFVKDKFIDHDDFIKEYKEKTVKQ